MEEYFVIYCVMDGEVGANPLGHASLLLAKKTAQQAKIQVTGAYGFYGNPSTDAPGSLSKKLKRSFRVDTDFSGNFGRLKQEEMRFLDVGAGLSGHSFRLRQSQYVHLQQLCERRIEQETLTMQRVREMLQQQGISNPSTQQMYRHEQNLARKENRKSVLHAFDFQLNWTFWGPSLQKSHTCKSEVIHLLEQVGLEPKFLALLTEHGNSKVVPHWSGPKLPVVLHSEGPLHSHRSQRTQKVSWFRRWPQEGEPQDETNNLYLTTPALLLDGQVLQDCEGDVYPKELLEEFCHCLGKFQKVEHALLPVQIARRYRQRLDDLIDRIRDSYLQFSSLKYLPSAVVLEKFVEESQSFFNRLYFAMADNWLDFAAIETVAARLDEPEQRALCKAMGRTWVEPVFWDEDEFNLQAC